MICPGCEKDMGDKPRGVSLGDEARALNALTLMTHHGPIIYLCVPCGARACDLAREILAITRNDYLHFRTLVMRAPTEEDPCARFVGPHLKTRETR